MVNLGETDVGEQADLPAGAQQVDVLDPGQILGAAEVLAHVPQHRNVVEVAEVVADYATAELVDRLVPEVVQGGVEETDRGGHDHLAHIERAPPVLLGQASKRPTKAREQHLALVDADEHPVCGQSDHIELV